MTEDLFYTRLRRELEAMNNQSKVYKLVRDELKKRGLWKGRSRKPPKE